MSDSELDFSASVKEVQSICLDTMWKPLYSTITFPPSTSLDEEQFLYFFLWLSNGLFFFWSQSIADDERRAIQIPDKDLVAKYSEPVVYYVTGWTLQRTGLALLVEESERYKYQSFAKRHSITAQYAKDAELPCELVEMRQKKCLCFPDKQYFEFIKLVESIYVHNLTVSLMMAYVDGDLMQAIDSKIKSCEEVLTKFSDLFTAGDMISEADRLDIMNYILERYIKMRGCWFVKYVKTSQNKSRGEMRVAAQPTRTMVANQHVQSKAIAMEKAEEKAVWEHAGKEVIVFEDDKPGTEKSNKMDDDKDIEDNGEY